jgi:hypothetical protein
VAHFRILLLRVSFCWVILHAEMLLMESMGSVIQMQIDGSFDAREMIVHMMGALLMPGVAMQVLGLK